MPMLLTGVALQAFDQWSTLFLLSHGCAEAMLIPALCIFLFGAVPAIIGLKTLSVGLLCLIAYMCKPKDACRLLGALNVYYAVLLATFNARFMGVIYG